MSTNGPENKSGKDASEVQSKADNNPTPVAKRQLTPPKEIGGRGGLDPTRYGDWEKAGRCIDF